MLHKAVLHSKCVDCVLWCPTADLVFACLLVKKIKILFSSLGIFEKFRVSVLGWMALIYIRSDNHRTDLFLLRRIELTTSKLS